MSKLEPINIRPYINNLDKEFKSRFNINPIMDIDKNLDSSLKKNRKLLKSNLDDYLILFDEGVKVTIGIHEFCKQNKVDFTFLVLTSKLVTLSLGMRKMLYSGFVDCTKNLYRPFIETIDVLFACLIDEKLNKTFGNTKEIYNSNDFYWENLTSKKLKNSHIKLFKELKITNDYIEYLMDRRNGQRSFLSESIHASFLSSTANFVMSTIDWDISFSYYGKITTAYPELLLQLIEEFYIYSQIFFKTLELKLCPKFIDIKIDTLTYHRYRKFEYLYSHFYSILKNKTQDFIKVFSEIEDELKNKK